MASTSSFQRPKERDGALSALDVLIQVLSLAKDTCGVPPAQIALGSAVALLTMIRVRIPSLCDDGPLTLVYPGLHDQRTGLCRARSILWRYMSGPRPGVERETIGRSQPAGAWGNRKTDYVSWSTNARVELFIHPRYLNRRTVAEIQGRVVKKATRNPVSRFFRSKNDKDAIAAWRQDLNRILQIFNVRSVRPS